MTIFLRERLLTLEISKEEKELTAKRKVLRIQEARRNQMYGHNG